MVFLIGGGRDLSTLAGWASDLFSLASAAAVTCATMNPELRPARLDQKRRQAGQAASISNGDSALEIAPISASAIARISAADRHRLGVEVAARKNVAVAR